MVKNEYGSRICDKLCVRMRCVVLGMRGCGQGSAFLHSKLQTCAC